jgi:NAD-dependent DNA ligase
MIKSIPLTLQSPFPPRIEVRGEVILMKEVFIMLNKENKKLAKHFLLILEMLPLAACVN